MPKLAFALALVVIVSHAHSRPENTITREQARQLLLKALQETDPQWAHLPKFGLDYYRDPYFPGFFFFEAGWDNPVGTVVLGHYAVNPRTADVWEATGCHRLHPVSIKPLQESLRRKIGLSDQEYRKLTTQVPCSPN